MESKVEYRVKKTTIMQKMCPSCRGGKREIKMPGGGFKTENCIHCTNGVAPIEHITDVSLKTALLEIGIVSLIKSVFEEMKQPELCKNTTTEKPTS